MVDAIAGIVTLVVISVLGYGLPIRLGLREARRRGVSPHWLWFGVYPFVGWLVWAIIRTRPPAMSCPSCKALLRAGDRYCPACALPLPNGAATANQGVQWVRAEVACAKCTAPVKLTASICTKCGTPPPSVQCPSCQSPRTLLVSRRTGFVTAAIVFMGGASVPFNNLNQQPRYAASLTLAELITLTAAMAVFMLGALTLFYAFTWHAFHVRC